MKPTDRRAPYAWHERRGKWAKVRVAEANQALAGRAAEQQARRPAASEKRAGEVRAETGRAPQESPPGAGAETRRHRSRRDGKGARRRALGALLALAHSTFIRNAGGFPPPDPESECRVIAAAVAAVLGSIEAGEGVVVYCHGWDRSDRHRHRRQPGRPRPPAGHRHSAPRRPAPRPRPRRLARVEVASGTGARLAADASVP